MPAVATVTVLLLLVSELGGIALVKEGVPGRRTGGGTRYSHIHQPLNSNGNPIHSFYALEAS